MANNYEIDYKDSRFTEVETDKKAAINEVDKTYGDMISQSDKYYDDQIQASKDWADKQTQLQQEQTDFAIEKIEQNKAQSKKDYLKEQSGAYVDWQKQSNEYGANAEKEAAMGMANTGFSESSQVSMYNAYQNRFATARASFDLATQNYNNQITEAKLQNNSILAEIAYQAYTQQAELALQGFQYKNTLLLEQANKKLQVDEMYYQRYQDVLQQINHENALAEEIRQYNATLALQKKQLEEEKRQFDILHPANTGGSGGTINKGKSSSGKGSKKTPSRSTSTSGIKTGTGLVGSKQATTASQYEVDTKSVLNLGQGPISGGNLAKQVYAGNVNAGRSGTKIVASYANPTKDLLFSSKRF